MLRFKVCAVKVLLILLTLFQSKITAQDDIKISAGADVVSRYVWRGYDIGNSPNLQPNLKLFLKDFELGVWGTYAMDRNASVNDELNFWLKYSVKSTELGSIKIQLIDYYFPNQGIKIGNFSNYASSKERGAHTLNFGFDYTIPGKYPLRLSANSNIYNDKGYSSYFEIGYSFKMNSYSLELFTGATPGSKKNSAYYETDNFAVVNIGVTATKKFEISEKITFPIFITWCVNPNTEQSHVVLGLSI